MPELEALGWVGPGDHSALSAALAAPATSLDALAQQGSVPLRAAPPQHPHRGTAAQETAGAKVESGSGRMSLAAASAQPAPVAAAAQHSQGVHTGTANFGRNQLSSVPSVLAAAATAKAPPVIPPQPAAPPPPAQQPPQLTPQMLLALAPWLAQGQRPPEALMRALEQASTAAMVNPDTTSGALWLLLC